MTTTLARVDIDLNSFQHLSWCYNCKYPNVRRDNGKKPMCKVSIDGKRCNNLVSYQGCIVKKDDEYYGICTFHWKEQCKEFRWNSNISMCANIIADRLGISTDLRRKISFDNIRPILNITPYNHHIAKRLIRVKPRCLKPKIYTFGSGSSIY
jgi:hypothetical protein